MIGYLPATIGFDYRSIFVIEDVIPICSDATGKYWIMFHKPDLITSIVITLSCKILHQSKGSGVILKTKIFKTNWKWFATIKSFPIDKHYSKRSKAPS